MGRPGNEAITNLLECSLVDTDARAQAQVGLDLANATATLKCPVTPC